MNPVQIIGILNITPDSFYDCGKYADLDAALRQVEKLLKDGADILDIGGQGSLNVEKISVEEELRRVIPVVTRIRKQFPEAKLSIDTMQSVVAAQAIEAGAAMINDVSAGRSDPQMFTTIADSPAHLVLMYSKDIPPTKISNHQYKDVVADVKKFLQERSEAAVTAGVSRDKIILDPGLGFFIGTDARYSLEILARLSEFSTLGFPLYVSPSRKSFLAGDEKLPPAERLPGTIAASSIAVLNGASYIRTHDVLEVRRACEIAEGIRNGKWKMENTL